MKHGSYANQTWQTQKMDFRQQPQCAIELLTVSKFTNWAGVPNLEPQFIPLLRAIPKVIESSRHVLLALELLCQIFSLNRLLRIHF